MKNQMKDNYSLCLKLLEAENEKDVESILEEYGFLNSDESWQYFGNKENNWGVIGNQQAEPEAALVEKLVNAQDAILLLNCHLLGINPESENAPKSTDDALERFFKIKNGNLSLITSTERTKLAGNIGLIATGKKLNPNYIIFDRGEGQAPNDFSDTFLSMNESNKLRIPFVQGTYNMGGTGVQRFCGDKNFQLIVSKRHPKLLDRNGDSINDWGFTIIRRVDPTGGMKTSAYKFLAPNGKILKFDQKDINIPLIEQGTQNIPPLEWGTIIKLYEFEMTGGLKTNILLDLYNKVSLLLPKVGIPIRFYERRNYRGHSFESTMSGLFVRLEDDKRKNIENNFPTSFQFIVDGQKFKGSIYVFKKDSSKKYRKNEGVIFSINGQSHGFIKTTFFKNSAKLDYLSDSILIIIDCNEIDQRTKEILFMTSRDRRTKGKLSNSIESEIEKILRSHKGLRELNNQRRSDLISKNISESKPLKEILNNVIKNSPSLQALFLLGGDFSNPYKKRKAGETKKFKGKRFPTYFLISNGQEEKDCHINQRFKVQFETDVENEYFSRNLDPGHFDLKINGEFVEEVSLNLWNGIATLNISLPKSTKIGDLLIGELAITDNSRIDPIINHFKRNVKKEIKPSKGKGGTRRKGGENNDGDRSLPDKFALPEITDVTENEWDRYSFDEFSALKVNSNGDEGYDFFINIDNKYLKHEIKQLKLEDESNLVIEKFKTSMVLLGLALLKDKDIFENKYNEISNNSIPIDEVIFLVSRAFAPLSIPMVDALGKLTVQEVTEE